MNWLNQATSKAKSLVITGRNAVVYHFIEAKVREATSNQPCDSPRTLFREIAESTYTFDYYVMTMKTLWDRLKSTDKNWRHVYKSLLLMEHLLIFGDLKCVLELQDVESISKLETIKEFEYEEADSNPGQQIRELATRLVTLIKDKVRTEELRNMADNRSIIGFTPEGQPITNPKNEDQDLAPVDNQAEENHPPTPSKYVGSPIEYFDEDDIMSPEKHEKPVTPSRTVDEGEDADEDAYSTGELDDVVMDAEKLRAELDEARRTIFKLRTQNRELRRENDALKNKLRL
ncbi:epsin [Acrasis kona]|uniref:Epsin n=1 Tax=Acrasis kona TaxID=1008807 RepID=A0AAW2ZCZ1_9EUKA